MVISNHFPCKDMCCLFWQPSAFDKYLQPKWPGCFDWSSKTEVSWFDEYFYMFTPICGGNDPIWLILFKWVETASDLWNWNMRMIHPESCRNSCFQTNVMRIIEFFHGMFNITARQGSQKSLRKGFSFRGSRASSIGGLSGCDASICFCDQLWIVSLHFILGTLTKLPLFEMQLGVWQKLLGPYPRP